MGYGSVWSEEACDCPMSQFGDTDNGFLRKVEYSEGAGELSVVCGDENLKSR